MFDTVESNQVFGSTSEFVYCALTRIPTGWNSHIGDHDVRISIKDNLWVWTGSVTERSGVVCMKPVPGLPTHVTFYTATQSVTNIGRHYYCALAGLQVGHQTSIGNARVYVDVRDGTWTLFSSWTGPLRSQVVCLG